MTRSKFTVHIRSRRRNITRQGFDTKAEAEAFAERNQGAWDPHRKIEVRPSNEEDHAYEFLEQRQEQLAELIDSFMNDSDHPLWPLACSTIIDGLKEAVTETISPYFEDDSPMAMGWVGSDGRP